MAELGPIRRALLLRALDGRLPGPMLRVVHRRIGADPAWRAAYDALRRAEHAVGGGSPSAGQRAALERLVVDSVRPARRGRRVAFGLAAAAACAAVVVVALPTAPDDLRPRGAATDERVGVRVRCVTDAEPPALLAETVLPATGDGVPLSCPTGALLVFSTTNLSEAPVHVFVLGIRGDGEPLWYAPFERAGRSVRVEPETADRLLEVAAETAGMTSGDRVTLFALFSDRPLSGAAVDAQLDGARRRGVSLRGLDRLPVAGARQGRAAMAVSEDPR